jgi:endonuclease/exonuclease/phosphatase family metal-dependent hydrolase
VTRINRGIAYVQQNMLHTDFLAYQETETTINAMLDAGLGSTYQTYHVFHDDTYWANWITEDPAFNRNGVSVAVNLNKYEMCTFTNCSLGTGNHAAVATCRNIAIQRWVRFVSVHFDSDTSSRRATESAAIVAWLNSDTSNEYIDIIAGDYNADTDAGTMKNNIINAGFVDVLRAVGIAENTSPWTGSGQNIDHLCVRGLRTTPVSGLVHSNNLWNLYPVQGGPTGQALTDQRITSHMNITGSDHFPIEATFNAQQ